MKLIKARVQNYRSINDTEEFEIEELKTILVGPNEAGKTVLLQALQQLNKPDDVDGFDALRDYPRSKLNDLDTGTVKAEDVEVATGVFQLEDDDKEDIPTEFHKCNYVLTTKLNNKKVHRFQDAPKWVEYKDVKNDLARMAAHLDQQHSDEEEPKPSDELAEIVEGWYDWQTLTKDKYTPLKKWLEDNFTKVEEDNEKEEKRYESLIKKVDTNHRHDQALRTIEKRVPVFILFNNYFRVRPNIHLEHLADRSEQGLLEDEFYDYGNLCLLKLLGFSPRELSDIGKTVPPASSDSEAFKEYRDALDSRRYKLNAASVRLTEEIRKVWQPTDSGSDADNLKVTADGQYLKVVVEDELGVEVELDQRSEGFQWLVSFFVVFFSEAKDKHQNAILLLDEPGMSLHAFKQRDFQQTISRLAAQNQTIYTTHSPFLVGPNELDIVRVVEMKDRRDGTKVHTTISSEDPAGLLPLQEALGYDLAHSLFSQKKNLVLEGITDYWYLEATSELLRSDGKTAIDEKIALVFANSAGKVVYYATILHAHKLKVAALLDSDAAGNQAAEQDNLVHTLGNKKILRTKDYCSVTKAEIEDLLRETLIEITKKEFGTDVSAKANSQPNRPIVDLFDKEVQGFSKYKLAKAYVRWTREHTSSDLKEQEANQFEQLISAVNKALK